MRRKRVILIPKTKINLLKIQPIITFLNGALPDDLEKCYFVIISMVFSPFLIMPYFSLAVFSILAGTFLSRESTSFFNDLFSSLTICISLLYSLTSFWSLRYFNKPNSLNRRNKVTKKNKITTTAILIFIFFRIDIIN